MVVKDLAFWKPYLLVTGLVAALSGLLWAVEPRTSYFSLLFLLPVLGSAAIWGRGPSVLGAALSAASLAFLAGFRGGGFPEAVVSFLVSGLVLWAAAALVSGLAFQNRQQAEETEQRETVMEALYALSREMTAVANRDAILGSITKQVAETVGSEVAIYLADELGRLQLFTHSGTPQVWWLEEATLAIVGWVYKNGQMAGRGTRRLRDIPALFLPLRTEDQVHGVLVVYFNDPQKELTARRLELSEALASLGAVAISRVKLEEAARLAHLTTESERLRAAILDSISHELRTPLATVIGSASGLLEKEAIFSSEARRDLLVTILEGARRMERLVVNLLGMVRLESGMLALNLEWCDLEDIIGVSLAQVREALQGRQVELVLEEDLPWVNVDDVLMEQVLVNLLSNACKYSPIDSTIQIAVGREAGGVFLRVEDEGGGIAPGEAERVFDKFYRSRVTAHIPGTGLGLAICKGIVEAHGGRITAGSGARLGTTVSIFLPETRPSSREEDQGA